MIKQKIKNMRHVKIFQVTSQIQIKSATSVLWMKSGRIGIMMEERRVLCMGLIHFITFRFIVDINVRNQKLNFMNLDQPIPLIQFQGQKFTITQEAIDFMRDIQGPFGVVTIVGKYRTGKSLFLNKVLLNNSDSFKVCPTINSCTKGLWISRKTIKSQHPEFPDMETIVIDTEGFGAMEESDAYNNRILLFALLLSSYFIYNSVGSIDEKSLNNLNIITNLAKELQSKNMSNQKLEEEFPSFMWIVRDFTLRLVDENGFPMDSKEYLEKALEIQKGVSDATENKNKIRRMIKHFFKERDCCTLVTPVDHEDKLHKLNSLPEEQFRPEFIDQINSLRSKIMRKIRPKRIKNRKLTGETFIELANSYITAINGGNLPNLDSAWKTIISFENGQILSKMKNHIQKQLLTFTETIHLQTDFLQKQKELLNEVHDYLKKFIFEEKDVVENFQKIKSFSIQVFADAKERNNKNSFSELVQLFHQKEEEFKFEDSLEEVERGLREMEKSFKEKYQQNPSLNGFMVSKFYPYKSEILLNFARNLKKKNQEQISNSSIVKQTLELKLRQSHEENKNISHQLFETQRSLTFAKAKLEEEQKIKSLSINYLEKEGNELRQASSELQERNYELGEKLREVEMDVVQLKERNENLNHNLIEIQDDRKLLRKQIEIIKKNLAFKIEEISSLKANISELNSELDKANQREQGLHQRTKHQIQNRSSEFQNLKIKYENSQAQVMNLHKQLSKVEATCEAQSIEFEKERNLYENMLETLKENFEKEFQHREEIIQANKNMAFALKHLEQRFEQAEEKEKKLKEYKRCLKNSSCLQCQNCSKFFVPTIFPQHLNVCILGPETLRNRENEKSVMMMDRLEILVKQTLLKDSQSKPYTEYVLEIHKNSRSWTIYRKYKALCDLHSQLKAKFPGVHLSDFSYIVNPQQGSKRSLLVEERKKILEQYLKDLSVNPHVTQTSIWKDFIQDSTEQQIMSHLIHSPNSKLALSSLIKSNLMSEIPSPDKENNTQHENKEQSYRSPEEFLKIWNERNLRVKEISKAKRMK